MRVRKAHIARALEPDIAVSAMPVPKHDQTESPPSFYSVPNDARTLVRKSIAGDIELPELAPLAAMVYEVVQTTIDEICIMARVGDRRQDAHHVRLTPRALRQSLTRASKSRTSSTTWMVTPCSRAAAMKALCARDR